jgi:antitoxin PrlF
MWGKILLEAVEYSCYAAAFVSGRYMEERMRETVIVSSRGQITLPAKVRKRLGITPGSVVLVEEREGELVLRPVGEIELYTEKQIAEWDKDDRLSDTERLAICKHLGAAQP